MHTYTNIIMHYVLYFTVTDNTSTGDHDINVPVTDNSCYESVMAATNRLPVADNPCYAEVIKKDRLQCTVAVPNPCYEVVSTEQHKTTDEHKRTT